MGHEDKLSLPIPDVTELMQIPFTLEEDISSDDAENSSTGITAASTLGGLATESLDVVTKSKEKTFSAAWDSTFV
jgi:hypothetical protein